MSAKYPKDDQDKSNNNRWCFLLSYAAAFLLDGLKLPADKPLTVQQDVNGADIEWAIGAVYVQLSAIF